MKKYKISVCIPVYKVEKYIEKCARSLFESTLDDIEFLFCDDCSPDKSIEYLKAIIKEYPERAESIKILYHEKNLGHSEVFKTLLTNASGEYIITCDSDDWVEPDMYKKMYTIAKKENADVIGCGHYIEYLSKHEIHIDSFNKSQEYIFQEWLTDKYPAYSWATLVHHSIIKKLEYISCGYVEDCTRACQVLHYSTNYRYIAEPLYHYRCQQQGVTSYSQLNRRIQFNYSGYTWIFNFTEKYYGDKYSIIIRQKKLSIKLGWLTNGIINDFYSKWPEVNNTQLLHRLNISIPSKIILWLAIHHYQYICNILIKTYSLIKKNIHAR